jgi:hypothetical protein
MALHFNHDLQQALENIQAEGYHELLIHDQEEKRDVYSSCEIIEGYGEAKHEVVEIINQYYGDFLSVKFDLMNWVNKNQDDEVSYFLNEVGSNVLSHSEFKAPHKFHLWFGKKGFIIGVEQKGSGFDAEEVHNQRLKENEGAAFNFFRSCQSKIFFDNSKNANLVFMEFKF